MEKGQIIANWAQLIEDNINILVPLKNYNLIDETRNWIPFQKGLKFGMLSKDGDIIVPPNYDYISSENEWIKVGIRYSYGYPRKNDAVQTYNNCKWGIINSKGKIVLEPKYGSIIICENSFIVREAYGYGTRKALIDLNGNIIVPYGKYSDIEPFVNGLARCRNYSLREDKAKRVELFSVIDVQGNIVLECKERKISPFYGRYKYNGLKDLKNIILKERPSVFKKYFVNEKHRIITYNNIQDPPVSSHFEEYAGSYAQDIMGYSDEAINDAFDGDPDAYWNID